jgi:hypothetical protein
VDFNRLICTLFYVSITLSPLQCPRSRAFTGRSFGRCGGQPSESAGLTFRYCTPSTRRLVVLDCEQVPPRQCPQSRALIGRSFGRRGLLQSGHQAFWARYPHPLHIKRCHVSCRRAAYLQDTTEEGSQQRLSPNASGSSKASEANRPGSPLAGTCLHISKHTTHPHLRPTIRPQA